MIQAFEIRQTAAFDKARDRFRQKPILETLTIPSSLFRACLILPMPWLCFYSTLQLITLSKSSNADQVHEPTTPWKFLAAFLMAYFFIDLMTGLIHMRLDTIKIHLVQDRGPLRALLEQAAWGFQRHHAVQHNWRHDDLLDSGILTTGLLTFPFFLVYFALYATGHIVSPYVAFAWTVFITTGMHVQIIHATSHNTWKNKEWLQSFIEILRSCHLLLDLKVHHEHHTHFDRNFSMVNGWSNFLLNPFYAFLEANGCIDPGLTAAVQRQVYIEEKARLSEPYLRIFPEYRAYQKRLAPKNTNTNTITNTAHATATTLATT